MTEQNTDFDPNEHSAKEVVEQLDEVAPEEREQIVAAELSGRKRKSVLEAAGVDPSERRDASGRVLNEWETSPAPLEN